MPTTISADGTAVAYSTTGSGPAVIVVDGALCFRGLGPSGKLATELAGRGFTAITYDRRGRGESGDGPGWSREREVEDLAALVDAVGGRAALLGISSGAVLALETAKRLDSVTRVVGFEAPVPITDERRADHADLIRRVDARVAAGDSGGAVRAFLKAVGMPGPMVRLMALTPVWRKMKATGAGLPRDLRIVAGPHDWDGLDVPALVLDGGKSDTWMRDANAALAAATGARYATVPGVDHMAKATVLAPVVAAFLDEEEDDAEHEVDREQLHALEPR